MVSTWRVGTPERQRSAVDAIARTWQSRPWPDVGLLSYSVLTGEDGDTLLHYSQWVPSRTTGVALAGPGNGVGSRTQAWERVQNYPGTTGGSVRRYTPAISLGQASAG
jgi:hypothetical protein